MTGIARFVQDKALKKVLRETDTLVLKRRVLELLTYYLNGNFYIKKGVIFIHRLLGEH